MKRVLAITVITLTCSLSLASTYEQVVRDCLDYGHSNKTESQVKACKDSAKEEVLSRPGALARYNDCTDYGHSSISEEREVQCLQAASAK